MNKTTTVKLRYLRMTPRKTRFIADLIRGLSVNEAEAQLLLHSRRAAKPILKLLRSAVNNAKNLKLDTEALVVKTIAVDTGPMLKRFLPRARGSASPIQRKMCHVTLTLEEVPGKKNRKYSIVIPKKDKKEKEKVSGHKDHDHNAEKPAETQNASESKGLMKRVFRRKVGE